MSNVHTLILGTAILICGPLPGCGRVREKPVEVPQDMRIVVTDFWHAYAQRESEGLHGKTPSYRKAYEVLHPETKRRLSLRDFSHREFERTRATPFAMCDFRIDAVVINDNSAEVRITLFFGESVRSSVPFKLVMSLRRHNGAWTVVDFAGESK